MDIFSNHKKLYVIATILFLILTLFVAILPALDNQSKIHPLPDAIPLTQSEKRGKDIFIANGCVACHSQQVRNVEMDRKWGVDLLYLQIMRVIKELIFGRILLR